MKNPRQERLRRRMKQYHRTHQWRLDGGLFIPHAYPSIMTQQSWWDDVGFILNGRRVMVYWQHPRQKYVDAMESTAWDEAGEIPGPDWFTADSGLKNWKKVGKSRKKVVSYTMPAMPDSHRNHFAKLDAITKRLHTEGIELSVTPSMCLKNHGWCLGVDLCIPIEVRSREELMALAGLAKHLVKGEATLKELFPGYRYERADWLSETELRNLDTQIKMSA